MSMWLGPPSSQTMMTALEEARLAGSACAWQRNRSASVRPPTHRLPSLRKLRRETPSHVLSLRCWELIVSMVLLRSRRLGPAVAIDPGPVAVARRDRHVVLGIVGEILVAPLGSGRRFFEVPLLFVGVEHPEARRHVRSAGSVTCLPAAE